MVMQTFERYFQHIHPIPVYSFLHKASLIQRYSAGQLAHVLLLAITGIALQLIDSTESSCAYGLRCIDTAQQVILNDIERPSVIKIQALVLIIKYRTLTRRSSSAAMLLALTTRYAFALRLNYEHPSLPFLAQEARRRLMWAIFMLDSAVSGCIEEFTLCSSDLIHLQIPCREENFELDLPEETKHLWPCKDEAKGMNLGLLAFHIRIFGIRDRVLR